MVRRLFVTLHTLGLLAFGFGMALAQTAPLPAPTPAGTGKSPSMGSAAIPALPRTLKGGIHFINPIANRHAFNPLEIEIANQDPSGKFTGTFTRFVAFAGAETCVEFRKVPMQGTYDGNKLTLEVRASAKVGCADFTWELGRGKEHDFERTSVDGAERVYFDLAK